MFKILTTAFKPFHNYMLCTDVGPIKPTSAPTPPPPSPTPHPKVLRWKEPEILVFQKNLPPAQIKSPSPVPPLLNIVGGTHRGKKAFFIKKTKKRIMVRIEGVGERYLSPKSLDL